MNTRKILQTCCALALGLAMYIPVVHADTMNEEARLTFSRPVQVSNTVILPAGTYSFRLADMTNYPNNAVQIFDWHGKFVTTVMTEATSRTAGTAPLRVLHNHDYENLTKARLQFAEGPDYDTLVKYFYTGVADGHKFTYSHQQEQVISEEPMVDVAVVPERGSAPDTLLASNR